MPSAFPEIGEVKHSSVGIFGLKKIFESCVVSPPAKNLEFGISHTLKLVPFEDS